MKQVKLFFVAALCCLTSFGLFAQEEGDPVYEVNLAGITNINLTLNEDCRAMVIPEMVLTGDFDVDGDGNTPPDELFQITVLDGMEGNGPIIDGCGVFTYRVDAMDDVTVVPAITGIQRFANVQGGAIEAIIGVSSAELFVSFTFEGTVGTPSEGILIQTDGTTSGDASFAFIDFGINEAGVFSLDYDFETDIPPSATNSGDLVFAFFDFEGEPLNPLDIDLLVLNSEPGVNTSGSISADVPAGSVLRIGINDDGFSTINDGFQTRLLISNVSLDPADIVFPVVGFETTWGTVNAEDKTAPTVTTTPDDIDLLCVDLEGNDLSTLPISVDRCYQVNAQTGATIPGTMASALRTRLLARTGAPVVPTFDDGCSALLDVCVNDVVTLGTDPACDDIVITRTFTATEVAICASAAGEGNPSVVASYDLTFIRPTLDDLNADNIEEVVEINNAACVNVGGLTQAQIIAQYPAARTNDFPFLQLGDRRFNLSAGDATCNIGVTTEDGAPIVTCDFTYKFVRTYTVVDWCEPSDVRTFSQIVKVGDTTAPTFTGPNVATNGAGDLVFGTNAGNTCEAFLRLDDVTAVDDCSGTDVTIFASIFPGGNLNGTPIGSFVVRPGGTPELSTAIPAGRHILRYVTTDQCNNSRTDDFFFIVKDQTPPVAICEDGLNISIAGGTNNGFAVLTADHLDAGSYDDCSGITRSIARVGDNDLPLTGQTYGPQINLTCDDLGTVRVSLRVEDGIGNVNFCWLDVLVEDKLAPTCVAPASTSITCDVYNEMLPDDIRDADEGTLNALFGSAVGVDNCGTEIASTVMGLINSCGSGSITRQFVSTDDAGFSNTNNCYQFIEVLGVHNYQITFPTDVSSICGIIPDYEGVTADELACDLITTTTDVDTLRTQLAGEECFKLRIVYDVINWCEYNSLGEPYIIRRDANGANNRIGLDRRVEDDVLYVNVLPRNTSTTDDDFAFISLNSDRTFNSGPVQQDQQIGDNGSDDIDDDNSYGTNVYNSRGFFRYTQFVKIYDEFSPEISFEPYTDCFVGNDAMCKATVELEFTARDECSAADVTILLDPNYNAAIGFVPGSVPGLDVNVDEGDNGQFIVTATNVPAGQHAIRVSASDGCGNFDVQIIEFCVTADRTPTPICIQTLTVVLADDGNNGGIAAIWASDFIASPILDCEGSPVTKYSLYRADDPANANPQPNTDNVRDIDCDDFANGTVRVRLYAFDDLGSEPNFCEVVTEVQDNAGHCGGSDGDLSGLITTDEDEVLEGVSVALTGANNMDIATATDVNGNFRFTNLPLGSDYTVQPSLDAAFDARSVKSSDLFYIIGNILGTTEFDSPYDYIAADVDGSMEMNIFDVINISEMILGIETEFDGGNWVFVRADAQIDMNNPYANAFPEVYNVNDLEGRLSGVSFVAVMKGNPFTEEGRSASAINVEDAQLEAGQLHTVVLDGSALTAFQGTIELAAGLELVSADFVGEGAMNLNNATAGQIAIAVRDQATVTLEVRATEAGLLSDMVTLTDAITVREGVAANGSSTGLDLTFAGLSTELTNSLAQNAPNPVADVTTIAYTLAEAGAVTLNIQDVQGRTVMVREMTGVAGRNVTTVNVSDLGAATGMLSYTLTAGNFSATKKMVVVR